MPPVIRVDPLNHQDPGVAERIHAVLLPAHAQEAQWLQAQQAPPLQRTPDAIRTSRDYFLGAFAGSELVGVLSIGPDEEPAQLDVSLLVVHPAHQRQGAATALLQEMLRRGDGMAFCVTTGSGNAPALALYACHGFVPYRHGVMGAEGAEGLGVVKLRRLPSAAAPAPATGTPAGHDGSRMGMRVRPSTPTISLPGRRSGTATTPFTGAAAAPRCRQPSRS